MDLVAISGVGSIFVQLVTGIIEASGLFLDVKPADEIVKGILAMELTVQVIEFMFYSYLVYMILTKHVDNNITSHRYIDWAISTPVMLISFVLFFKYRRDPTRKIGLLDSIKEERETLIKIVIANSLMLLFGFLSERGIINITLGVTLGFLPFLYIFYILYNKYVKKVETVKPLFYSILSVWSLYGVAAYLPFIPKNTMYNILDLFSKNAYGIYLYIYLRSISIS
jgi:bacteriorhodopsin